MAGADRKGERKGGSGSCLLKEVKSACVLDQLLEKGKWREGQEAGQGKREPTAVVFTVVADHEHYIPFEDVVVN